VQLFARRRRRRTAVLAITCAVAAAAAVVLVKPWDATWWPFGDSTEASPVPTVPVAATPVDIGCVDQAGDVSAAAAEWYHDGAAGAVGLNAEITMSSQQLARLSDVMLHGAADTFGSFATSAIRDLAPTPGFCTTHHYVQVTLADGSDIVTIAWRSVAASAARTLPNEGEFVALDDSTFASTGPHAVSVLAVAPDGTSVLVTGYGAGARVALTTQPGLVSAPTSTVSLGLAPATVEQLLPLAQAALAAMITR